MKTIKLLFLTILTSAFIVSCSDDDIPQQINEEEVITTMIITLESQTDGSIVTLISRDTDGDGPLAPEITNGTVNINTVYNGSIELRNELEQPFEDITEEVEEEDDEHQFFFNLASTVGTIAYADSDGDGNPVGLAFTLSTGSNAGITGAFSVTLIHEPAKDAQGVSDGDQTNAGGETDIEQTFQVSTQ